MQVIKVGGNELDERPFRAGLAAAVAGMGGPVVIVHGGGRAIAEMQARLGLRPEKVDGVRVTDAASLEVAQMVLSGQVNKRLGAALLAAGVAAVGLSGVDGGLLRCVRKAHPTVDLGWVGEIVDVNGRVLQVLLDAGLTPVVSPISLGLDGEIYNVNADEAARAVAARLRAARLTFVSNVPGVLDADGRLAPALTAAAADELVQAGVINGGMIPKVQAALQAVETAVAQARIVDLAGLGVGGGTLFTRE
ncbi:MAG: acetylglutamate kinase, partial [Anaerolineales bacterium]|nr:acetylglutamate kinase [Anaerolineales bacterium]